MIILALMGHYSRESDRTVYYVLTEFKAKNYVERVKN
jgi:hypothetical protein